VALGHSKVQATEAQVLRALAKTLSPTEDVHLIFATYCATRYPVIPRLYKVLGKRMLEFVNLFGGLTLALPLLTEDDSEFSYSHLPEIHRLFGERIAIDLYEEFRGERLVLPSPKYLASALREVDIYCYLERTKEQQAKMVRTLASRYQISSTEVRLARQKVRTALGGGLR